MNKWLGIGRLTADPTVRYSQGNTPTAVANFTLAVDRKFKREGDATADFIRCVAFSKTAETIEKYCRKGKKIAVEGHIQTGSYEKDGVRHYTTDIYVESIEFVESKQAEEQNGFANPTPTPTSESSPFGNLPTDADGFMHLPDGIDDSELPF